ncbi:hypothetical protein KW842_16185 [Duganella sp. sic0402]|uniref:hypothetical protein n=1 Tax=Duganella sp. sic0402 TaxID=2854786 RepID=UPI001C45315F|nr:hypothetical protein [Duganella sp. sic0402]MBV7537308.1 hypothetical protein [Duganella sp. sic0402]
MDTLRSSVRLPCDILVELGELTGYAWNSWELAPTICDAIRGYMRPPASNKHDETAAVANASTEAGHQWKQLFLPEGTRLRAAFGGEPYFAVVKGAEIRCGDRTVTPSGFANLQGSGNRNAWKAVWLRFPGNEQWVLADVCRSKQKIAIARLFGAADDENAASREKAAASPANAGPARDSRDKGGTHSKLGKRHKRHAAARGRSD